MYFHLTRCKNIVQPTRKEHNKYCQSWFPQLSCIVSDRIIIIISRGGAKSPGRILTRACPESTLQNLENFISARARNTRLEVRVSLCVLLIFRLPTKKKHRHSTIRATSLSVKFDAKIQDAREIPRPFAVLCAKKKKNNATGPRKQEAKSHRHRLTGRWASLVFTRLRGQSRYQWLET